MDFVYGLVRFTLLFGFNAVVFKAFQYPSDPIYFLAAGVIFSTGIILHKQLLGFLTVKEVFITRFITISLLVGVVMFILQTVLPGFVISGINFAATNAGFITFNGLTLNPILSICVIALFDGLVASLMYSLNKK